MLGPGEESQSHFSLQCPEGLALVANAEECPVSRRGECTHGRVAAVAGRWGEGGRNAACVLGWLKGRISRNPQGWQRDQFLKWPGVG